MLLKIHFYFSMLLLSGQALASQKSYDLPTLLQFANKNNLELQTEEFTSKINDAEYKRIMKEFNPKMELLLGIGPVSKHTGDALHSESDYTSWGVAYLGKAEMTWPLHTWGRREHVLQAMKHKIKVDEQDVALKKNEIIYNLKEAYYKTLFTYSLLDFVNDIQDKIDSKRKEKKMKKEEKYQMDILEAQIQSKKEDILMGQALGYEAIKLFAGVNEEFVLDKDYIQRESRNVEEFDYYWSQALNNKPEFIQLREGIAAKENLKASQEKELLPVLGILMEYEFTSTDRTTKQQSAFAYDPFNRNDFSFGVGFSWKLDFGVTKENIRKTSVEVEQLKRKKKYADNGLKLLVKKAWLKVKAETEKLSHARKAYKSGKKWVNRLGTSWAMGLTSTKKLVEAYQAWAFASKDYYEAILNHHLAWSELSKEVGIEVDPLLKN
jgi:outer membrane protein TolC